MCPRSFGNLSQASQITKHLRSDGTAFSGQIHFRLGRMNSFDRYESKAGRAIASAIPDTLDVSGHDEAMEVHFAGVDPDRLPFLADDGQESQYIRQRNRAAEIIK